MRDKIKAAQSVLVVGGGPNGVEMISNLAYKYKKNSK